MCIRDSPSLARFVPSNDSEIPKINGIVITLNMLITAVRDIERATSPLAKEVKIFEVAPPGAAARIITPIAISGDSGQMKTSINAIKGKIINCEIKPTKNSFGFTNILEKSEMDKPNPRENIINARAIGKTTSVTIFII